MKKAKRANKSEDWICAKRLRNDCLTRVRKAKAEFINTELENNSKDSNGNWQILSHFLKVEIGILLETLGQYDYSLFPRNQ